MIIPELPIPSRIRMVMIEERQPLIILFSCRYSIINDYLIIRYITQLSNLAVMANSTAPMARLSRAGQTGRQFHCSDSTLVADIMVMQGTGAAARHRMTAIHSATCCRVFFFDVMLFSILFLELINLDGKDSR